MSDGEESLENLAEMLRQMQLNRMRLEAMQTTHAVLLQTRDGLVRSMSEREAQMSAMCTTETTISNSSRKSGKRHSGMVRQRSDEDCNELRRVSRNSSIEAAPHGSRSVQSLRRSFHSGRGGGEGSVLSASGSVISMSAGSSEDGGSPVHEFSPDAASRIPRAICEPSVVEEDGEFACMSVDGLGRQLPGLGAEDSIGFGAAGGLQEMSGGACSAGSDDAGAMLVEEDGMDVGTIKQIHLLMRTASEKIADGEMWSGAQAVERVRELDRICSEIVQTEANSLAGSRASSCRGSEMGNSPRDSGVLGDRHSEPKRALALAGSPLAGSNDRPMASVLPPPPFLSTVRRGRGSSKMIPPIAVHPAMSASLSGRLASGRVSKSSTGSYGDRLSESVLSENSLDLSPRDANGGDLLKEGKRSNRSSWARLPADAFAAASRLSFNSKNTAASSCGDSTGSRGTEGGASGAQGSAHAQRSGSGLPFGRGGLAAKLGMNALNSFTSSFRATPDVSHATTDKSPAFFSGEPQSSVAAVPAQAASARDPGTGTAGAAGD